MNKKDMQLLQDYIDKGAKENPKATAIIQHEDDRYISYKKFKSLIDYFALRLADLGIQKGDIISTQLALFPEHAALMYACFRTGAIFAPLDLRLKKEEIKRDLDKIKPKLFFCHGNTPLINFNEVAEYVRDHCEYVEKIVQVLADPKKEKPVEGAVSIQKMMAKPRLVLLKIKDIFSGALKKLNDSHKETDPALIIFTTGTTGAPKPALMSHKNILIQNEILARATGMSNEDSVLINLPASHVACVTETMMTIFYLGGTGVFLKIFNVKESLKAIEKHKITLLGQIPTQFRMMWAEPDYDNYDLSSLKFAIYGGSSVDADFLNKLASMAPKFGTGMGMTETSGFTTFTPVDISVDEMVGQVGRYFEDLGKISIRKPMKEDGTAGDELPDGEIGEICYHPPIVFSGYYNMPEETAKVISKEGILYSGDIGYFKDTGSYKAMYLAGRAKFIIKQKGFQVFPDEVQAHIADHPKVDVVDVVGIKHKLFDEGIFAFVKPVADQILHPDEIHEHCKKIASYKRPQHVEIWPVGKDFPITRTTKIDKLELRKEAEKIVEDLRKQGKWDA